ncbi:unnamed protein product [Phytomonas sp. Hart1]|nr:unnamed protein product [Phytomonas sp. Hart1]|eukprot:CCW70871.1 unnamed protein product [Phytomonas sp. isolate Hart1]
MRVVLGLGGLWLGLGRVMGLPRAPGMRRWASVLQPRADFGPTSPAQRPKPSLTNTLYVVEPAQRLGSFRRYLGLAKVEVPFIAGAVIGVALYSAMTLAIPAGFGMLIDYASKGEMPLGTSMQLLGCFVLAAAGKLTGVWCIGYAGERIISNLRTRLYASILRQPAHFFDLPENRTGSLLQRLSMDCSSVGGSLTQAATNGSMSLILTMGSVGIMLYFSPLLTSMILCLIPPIAVFAGGYGRTVRRLQRSIYDAIASMGSAAEDRLSAIRTIKTLTAEEREKIWFSTKVQRVFERSLLLLKWRAAYESFLQLAGYGAGYCILWAGSLLIASGSLTPGVLFSFMLYTLYCGTGLIGLANIVIDLNKGYGASLRVFEIIEDAEGEEKTRTTTPQLTPSLTDWTVDFKDISFAYPTRSEALVYRGLNLTVHPARSTCIVGSSGCGKSSLALLLLKLFEPIGGVITLGGHNLADIDDVWLRQKIGYIGQDIALFDGTIAQNIAYGFTSYNWGDPIDRWLYSVVVDAAVKANAHDFISALPEGYDTFVGESGRSLSAGEKQRIAIARALVCNPYILILDEATSALDSESEEVVHDAIIKLIQESKNHTGKHELTVLMFAHKLSAVSKADHIVVLHNGTVAVEGGFEEVYKNEIFRSLMGLEDLNRLKKS